jgi:predicted PurR-regulated permease PerM
MLKLADKYDFAGVEILKEDVQGVIQRYIIGMLTVMLILAFLNTAGLWLVGLDHAMFFGGFAAFLALIPYLGIILGALPPVLFALLMYDSLLYAAGVIVVFGTIQFLEGNFITPNVMSSQVSINPLAAMLALFIGGQLWGIAGMILFIPLTGIMKVVFDRVDALNPYGYLLGNVRSTED